MARFGLSAVICLILLTADRGAAAAESTGVNFQREIAPIFARRCLRCHAPGHAAGDVSLETAADLMRLGYVLPGNPGASYLMELITPGEGKRAAMPKEGDILPAEEIDRIRRWISSGGKWPEEVVLRETSRADARWWSLQPLQDVRPPAGNRTYDTQATNAIDRFVLARLAAEQLELNGPADRVALMRRATYDLTGLPPAPDQLALFVQDEHPLSYERLLDRLLASIHYGERWGRHWLDVVRFGESNGYERNFIINDLWPFRDYVIDSWNDDKPFNRFIREHLAGDVWGPNQPEVAIGSAFLVAGPFDDVGNQDPAQAAQIRANTIDEMITATAGAFLGLTVGCARCHDHKFDPITQRDYYALYATFAGVRHGSRALATPEDSAQFRALIEPLQRRRDELTTRRDSLTDTILQRALARLVMYESSWTREPVDRQGTVETFDPVEARFVRLVSEGQDANPHDRLSFGIDEFEVWSAADGSSPGAGAVVAADRGPRNVGLASGGARASGTSRVVEDFPHAYSADLAIDGRTGERFLAVGGQLTIELAQPTRIDRVVFSSARGETQPEHGNFVFVAEYRIEVSRDGVDWIQVADSFDRRPVHDAHRNARLQRLEMSRAEQEELAGLEQELAETQRQLASIRPLPTAWIGTRSADDARGPFHVFLAGNPQRIGPEVTPASPAVPAIAEISYALQNSSAEADRRLALADWIAHPANPLTWRVLANRLWHYHFGRGIVDTPSDFGYMGGRPTHAELLDWLADRLRYYNDHVKPVHRLIMVSSVYRQSSEYRSEAGRVDGDSRWLWRFPPRRLSAEEIRDTILTIAGQLDARMGGAGFRLYRFMQDNVATYAPLDRHGPETFRRAVYHQNARASAVDLMSDFDQPDCAFATPKRATTTTPLQALTMLNHQFTVDISERLAARLEHEAGEATESQIRYAFQLCFQREPDGGQVAACRELIERYGLRAFCRMILNTSEMIYVR